MHVGEFESAAKFLKPPKPEQPKKGLKRLHNSGKENRQTRRTRVCRATKQKRPHRNIGKKNYNESWHISKQSNFYFIIFNQRMAIPFFHPFPIYILFVMLSVNVTVHFTIVRIVLCFACVCLCVQR